MFHTRKNLVRSFEINEETGLVDAICNLKGSRLFFLVITLINEASLLGQEVSYSGASEQC